MTKEEKVMFLMRLSVETHTAYQASAMSSPRGYSTSKNPMEDIDKLYEKFETFLDKKLAGESGQ